jgi:hypothetical protein
LNLTLITLKLTVTELQILTGLAADQLFRKEFIDSRLPGFRSNAPELNVGKQLVQRMRLAAGDPPVRRETFVSPNVRATGRHTP